MADPTDANGPIPVTFDFEPEPLRRLNELVTITGAASRDEVLVLALRLFDFVTTECDPKAGVTVTRNDGTKQTFYGNDF